MNQLRSRTRLRLFALALVLLIVALVGVACGSNLAPAAPTAAPATAAAIVSVPATSAPVQPAPAVTQAAVTGLDVPVGVDADGNFYRGDPNAPVKLIEFSDFQ